MAIRMRLAASLGAVAVLVAACGASSPSGSSGSSQGVSTSVGPSASAASVPGPTPNPEAIRKAAGPIYAAAAAKYNKDSAANFKTCKSASTLKAQRACYAGDAKIIGAFIAAVKNLRVPVDTAADLHALVARAAAEQALEIEGSTSKTTAAMRSVNADIPKADRATVAAANLVRTDLGLPPVS